MGNSSNTRKKNPTPTLSKSGWECGAGAGLDKIMVGLRQAGAGGAHSRRI